MKKLTLITSLFISSLSLFAGDLHWTGKGEPHNLFDKQNWIDQTTQRVPEGLESDLPLNENLLIGEGFQIGTDREVKGILNAGSGKVVFNNCKFRTDYGVLTAITSDEIIELENALVMTGRIAANTIELKGKSELHLYEEENIISGNTVINLNSDDAWLFLLTVNPSRAQAYLPQIKIKGKALSASNARVVPYYGGTVIIPHAKATFVAASFYEEENQQGAVKKSYKGDGVIQTGIYKVPAAKSILLKRGYMMTLSETASGCGRTKTFVADDSDLNINLSINNGADDTYLYARVLQWTWASKRGFCWGGYVDDMNVSWYYNWSANPNSSATTDNTQQYVAMRHGKDWPGLDGLNTKPAVTHLLGFNEPERPDQANMTVNEALARWEMLQGKGCLIGSPCPANSTAGKNWLIAFMDSCISRGYRVDYITLHNYEKMDANYFVNTWCKFWYDRYKIPVWVTEFNYGANWNSQTSIGQDDAYHEGFKKYVEALDAAPFIGRYAYYHFGASLDPMKKLYSGFESYTPRIPSRNGIFYREFDSRPERGNPILYRRPIMITKRAEAEASKPAGDLIDGQCFSLLSKNTDGSQRRKIGISSADDASYDYAQMAGSATSNSTYQQFRFEEVEKGVYKLFAHNCNVLSLRNDSVLVLPDMGQPTQYWQLDSVQGTKYITLKNKSSQQYLYPVGGKINIGTYLTTAFTADEIASKTKAHWEMIKSDLCGCVEDNVVNIHVENLTGKAPLTVKFAGSRMTAMDKNAYYVWSTKLSENDSIYSTLYADQFTFETPGSYTLRVRVRDYKGIDKVLTYPVEVSESTAIENVQEELSFKLFPNPTCGQLNFEGLAPFSQLSFFTPQGVLVYQTRYEGCPVMIDNLAAGVYFVQVNGYKSRMLIKQ